RQTFYTVVVIKEGDGETHIDFNTYPIERGMVYFITPGQVQRWASTQPIHGFVLLFQESFLPMSSADPITPRSFDYFHRTDLAPVLTPGDATQMIFDLCEATLRAYAEQGFGRTALLQSYLRVFLIQAQRLFARQQASIPASPQESLVTDYIRLIDRHFMTTQRVGAYAEMLGVTPGHLTDTTRAKLGVPAGQLIQRRVLLEAKRLLTHSEKSIGEIAFDLNFADRSYFSRYFRRETGESPSAFRDGIREKYPSPRSES
ncbi:MAG: AraC family transcriptional regulator, partial [Chloroflexota bacterium]